MVAKGYPDLMLEDLTLNITSLGRAQEQGEHNKESRFPKLCQPYNTIKWTFLSQLRYKV